METPEGSFCPQLTKVREDLWNAIGSYNMKLMNLAPAKFVHFGSIPEILELVNTGVKDYESLGWAKQVNSSMLNTDIAGYNSVLSSKANVGERSYLEVSYVHSGATIGKHSYISYIDIHSDDNVPDEVLVHGLKQMNGKFVCRIMGVYDNPKKNKLFGIDLKTVGDKLGIALPETLWNAELYPECETIGDAVNASLNLYHIIVDGTGDIEAWQKAAKKSLCSGFIFVSMGTVLFDTFLQYVRQ